MKSWIFILVDSCWNVIWWNCFVSEEISVCTAKISSWFWAVHSLLEHWLFLLICPCFSFLPPSLLMPFSTPTPVPLKLPPPRQLKWPWGISFLDGLVGGETFVIPRAIVLGWQSCLHFTLLETGKFSSSSAGYLHHFLYMERQILALGYSTWLMEVSQVGWISTCVDWRIIPTLQ